MLGLLDHLFNLPPGHPNHAGGQQDGFLSIVFDRWCKLARLCIGFMFQEPGQSEGKKKDSIPTETLLEDMIGSRDS